MCPFAIICRRNVETLIRLAKKSEKAVTQLFPRFSSSKCGLTNDRNVVIEKCLQVLLRILLLHWL